MVKVGITLPSFVDDAAAVFAIARAADETGIDGAFVFEHLFRTASDGSRRCALDCWATLGSLAVETSGIRLGPFAARATLRPAAVLAHSCATLQRIVGDRVLAIIGAGDAQSRAENEEFGVGFADIEERLAATRSAVELVLESGIETWVAGRHEYLLDLAARTDGWNSWGSNLATFAARAERVVRANPKAMVSWSGIVVVDATDASAESKAKRLGTTSSRLVGSPRTISEKLRPFIDAGAQWLILAPADSSNVANVSWLAEVKERLAS